ncbi:class I SAM-dependent methyltransferase [Rapidithrix thailandica]|uniref:Class I SAM-dependent methyltransferase n=1 Tax=Rapidithrix thailandica TaxID=413964 RepID=A0AAW9S736_9BACT
MNEHKNTSSQEEKTFTEEEVKYMAAQLRCPSGQEAVEVAQKLNVNNGKMTQRVIEQLSLVAGQKVLEIGMGNGAFIPEVLAKAPDLHYYGLELSEEMVKEAQKAVADLPNAQILHGSSEKLPFEDHQLDAVFTVNTLYFWEEPIVHLREIKRVLRTGGTLYLSFRSEKFMKDLPMVKYGFQLYEGDSVKKLLESLSFTVKSIIYEQDESMSFLGKEMLKDLYIVEASKS